MLQKTKLILTISSILLLVACFKDKGNYTYKNINEVAIKFDKKEYTFFFNEPVVIKPAISVTQPENDINRFTYKWFTYIIIVKKGVSTAKEEILGTKKELNIKNVRLSPKTYQVYLYVKDKKTGVEWQNKIKLNIKTLNYEGWLVLNEVNGGSRFDMITLLKEEYTPKYDILKQLGSSLKLKGMPKFVICYPRDNNNYRIYISTSGNGTTRIDPETFNYKKEYNISYEFSSKQPSDLEVDAIIPNRHSAYIINKGNLYFYNYMSPFTKFFSVPYNRLDGEKFKASMVAFGRGSNGTNIVYDDTNKQFVTTSAYSPQSCSLISGVESKFRWETGKNLVYIQKSQITQQFDFACAILKDTIQNTFFLAQFTFNGFFQNWYQEISATDFKDATAYAFDPVYGYLFYAVRNKVYQYDIYQNSTKLMLDKGSSVITLLKFHHFINNNKMYKKLQEKLIVCSYDPTKLEGSNGTMELYSVPPVNGQITLYQSYEGFGKIKSVSYRER